MNGFCRLGQFVAFLCCMGPLVAQQPVADTPEARLTEAMNKASLEEPSLKPWHLKLNITLLDSKGRSSGSGTVERWTSGHDSKTVTTFGTASETQLTTSGQHYAAESTIPVPSLADELMEQAVDPGPDLQELRGVTFDLRKTDFGKISLDCIMLAQPIKRLAYAPMGLFPTYCLDVKGTTLRASYNYGSRSVLRNKLGTFQGHQVATNLVLVEGGFKVAEADVVTLTTFEPTADMFLPTGELQITGGDARISGGVIAGLLLNKVAPTYPESAKMRHVSGMVVLHAIIGTDGHIHSLRPISTPDPDLAIAAIGAVRQWVYKPYLLMGMPVEVDTTITVNFNLSPG